MTQQDVKEYEWETGRQLLNESSTADDLIRHNSNVKSVAARGRDEAIDNMVRGLADKVRTTQDTSGHFAFALRHHGRRFPDRIRTAAAQFLMTNYEE